MKTHYDFDFWAKPPMTPRIYVMWALGNLVWVLLTAGQLAWRGLLAVPGPRYWAEVCVAIVQDGRDQPEPQPVQIREPGWVLREYRERMAAT